MKRLVFLYASLFLVTIGVQKAQAQTNVSDEAITSAVIITPLSIIKTVDLSFGNIVAGNAGTVTIGTDGTRTYTGGVTLPTATPGEISAASFDISGLANATYSITVPPAFDVTRTSGTETMQVSTFVTDPTPTGTLDASGAQTLKVGATLTVGASQAAGTYENETDLQITVAYN